MKWRPFAVLGETKPTNFKKKTCEEDGVWNEPLVQDEGGQIVESGEWPVGDAGGDEAAVGIELFEVAAHLVVPDGGDGVGDTRLVAVGEVVDLVEELPRGDRWAPAPAGGPSTPDAGARPRGPAPRPRHCRRSC